MGSDQADCKITRVDPPLSFSAKVIPPTMTKVTESFVQGTCSLHSLVMFTCVVWFSGDAMIFSSDLLRDVTDNFSKGRLIGKGGFGNVFKGKLRHLDVAIKVLNTVRVLIIRVIYLATQKI